MDLHHFRLFYTARVPQPMLLKTAVQIAVTVSVLAQTSLTIFYLTDDVNFWRKSSFREVAAQCSLLTEYCTLVTEYYTAPRHYTAPHTAHLTSLHHTRFGTWTLPPGPSPSS